MKVTSRRATVDDVETLCAMYRDLEEEQTELKSMWPLFDGLDLPIEGAMRSILEDGRSMLLLGEIDDVPLGFVWARSEPMLSRAGDEMVGVFRLIFTDPEARGVGVGEVMIEAALTALRAARHRRFDALVSPGHRAAKNFFEQNGFAARLIVMHHEDRNLQTSEP